MRKFDEVCTNLDRSGSLLVRCVVGRRFHLV